MSTRTRAVLGLLGLLVVSYLLRTTGIRARYWIDEGLSVGIAHHPLADIPGLLRRDGSPPLYYLLLGVWIRVLGDGEMRTHALSLVFALACVPAAWVLARALFRSERAAWYAAVTAALLPFLSYYAQETRMYTLVALLSMVALGAWAMAFLRGERRWLCLFAIAGAALIYTHNWGLFVLAGSALALVPALRAREVPFGDVAIGYGAIALLYLPWVPTLLYQAGHTGAPWANSPNVGDLPDGLASMAGGAGPAVALLLAGGAGYTAYLAQHGSVERRVAARLLAAALLGFLLAWVASQASPGWTPRYFAAIIGPLIVLAGGALARAATLGTVAMVLVAALWLHPPTGRVNNKSNVHHAALVAEPYLRPGDIAVVVQPEQLPVARFYFRDGLRWADGMGFVKDTRIFDWRDALDRYRAAKPHLVAPKLLAALRPGQQLVLMLPIIRTAVWNAPWTKLVRQRSGQWARLLNRRPLLQRELAVPHLGNTKLPHGIRIVLFRKLAQGCRRPPRGGRRRVPPAEGRTESAVRNC